MVVFIKKLWFDLKWGSSVKNIKHFLIVIVCMASIGILGGCTSNKDISKYLEALLDTSYKNDVSGFVDIKLGTEDEARALYNQGIDEGVAAFCDSLSVPEGLDDEFRSLYMDMLKMVKYEVGSAVKQSDGSYNVTVTYEKMNLFKAAVDIYEDGVASIVNDWANSEENIDEEEKQRQVILEFKNSMETAMSQVTYDEPKDMTVRIELVDNKYTPNMNDVKELEKALMDWE
jgi:hypothetical protein